MTDTQTTPPPTPLQYQELINTNRVWETSAWLRIILQYAGESRCSSLKRPSYNFVNLWQIHHGGSHTAQRRSSASPREHTCKKLLACASAFQGNHCATQVNTWKSVFTVFSQIYDSQEEDTPPPPPISWHGGEAAAAPRKSGGKPLMDNRTTTPEPQHLAPLSLLLHENNNKQVADLLGGFATVFPTVGAVDAEKFPFFCMHI